MNRRVVGILSVAGAFVVAAATVGAVDQVGKSSATTASAAVSSSPSSSSLSTSAPAATAKPTAVAIGDSIMDGHGLTVAQSWPSLLADDEGWALDDLASDGTGYVTVGDADDTFQAQADKAVALDPSIVILAGSSNDLGQNTAAVQAAEEQLVTTIAKALPNARIVAVNTFWGDTTPPAQLADFDSTLQKVVAGVGGTYLDVGQPLSNRVDLMQSDDVHPTAIGQKVLANSIRDKLPRSLKAAA